MIPESPAEMADFPWGVVPVSHEITRRQNKEETSERRNASETLSDGEFPVFCGSFQGKWSFNCQQTCWENFKEYFYYSGYFLTHSLRRLWLVKSYTGTLMLFPFFSFLRTVMSSSKSKASGWSKLYSFLAASSCSSLFNTWDTNKPEQQ